MGIKVKFDSGSAFKCTHCDNFCFSANDDIVLECREGKYKLKQDDLSMDKYEELQSMFNNCGDFKQLSYPDTRLMSIQIHTRGIWSKSGVDFVSCDEIDLDHDGKIKIKN